MASIVPRFLDDASLSFTHAFATRKVSTKYTGACLRVRNSVTGVETDIGFTKGQLDVAALLTACPAGSDGFVTTWYSQLTGGTNAVQTTMELQPRICSNGVVDMNMIKPGVFFKNPLATQTTSLVPTMTADTTGEFVASNGTNPFQAFDRNQETYWLVGINNFSNGVYTSNKSTTVNMLDSTSVAIAGEWIQIKLNTLQKISQYSISPRNSYTHRCPQDFTLVGSMDGVTWFFVDQRRTIPQASYVYGQDTVFVPAVLGSAYLYYQIICERLFVDSGADRVNIAEFKLIPDFTEMVVPPSALTTGFVASSSSVFSTSTTSIVPTMTSDSTSGFVASASSIYNNNDDYNAYKAFDADQTTFWHSNPVYTTGIYSGTVTTSTVSVGTVAGEWLQLRVPTPTKLVGYSISPRSGYTDRTPQDFTLLGSSDGTTWSVLDQRRSVAQSSYVYGQDLQFTPPSTENTYTYFRLVIEKTQITGGSSIQIAEFKLISSNTNAALVYDRSSMTYWSSSSSYSSGTYTGSTSTSITSLGTVSGEWVQIQVPSSVVVSKYAIANRLTLSSEAPKDWVLAGSLDGGSTWTLIDQKSSQTLVDSVDFVTNVTTPSYTTFRLIITKTQNSNVASIARLKLFGAYDSSLPRELLLIPIMVSNNHGSFVATASSASTSEYMAFDSSVGTSWSSVASKYTSQVPNGTAASTVTSVGTVLGEWVQIQLASKNRVTKYVLTPFSSNVPVSFLVVGSLNGTTWTLLDRRIDIIITTETTYTCSAPGDFQYLRLIVDKVSSGSTGVTLVNFQVAGYELDRPFLETNANVTPAALLTASSSGGVADTLSTNWLNGILSGNAGSAVASVYGMSTTAGSAYVLDRMGLAHTVAPNTVRSGSQTPMLCRPLDTLTASTTFTHAFSTRKISTRATRSLRVRNSVSGVETDIGFIKGQLDVAALLTACPAGSDGFVTTWYSQLTGGTNAVNAIQTTRELQPRICSDGVVDMNMIKPGVFFKNPLATQTTSLVPTMTASTTGEFVASASNSTNQYTAFDGNTGTYWLIGSIIPYADGIYTSNTSTTVNMLDSTSAVLLGEWLQIKLNTLQKLSQYIYVPTSNTSRNLKDFTLAGSMDGVTWFFVDQRRNVPQSSYVVNQDTVFVPAVVGSAYLYYRLICERLFTSGTTVSIIEFKLIPDFTEMIVPPSALTTGYVASSSSVFSTSTTSIVPVMTSDSTSGFVASASSIYGGNNPYQAFNADQTTFWHSNPVYTTGIYSGTVTTSTVSAGSVAGEWLQIKVPTATKLLGYSISPRTTYTSRCPTDFTLLGSSDGVTWSVLDQRRSVAQSSYVYDQDTQFTPPPTGNTYTYFRLVFEKSFSGANSINIAEFKLIPLSTAALVFDRSSMTYWTSVSSYSSGTYTGSTSTSITSLGTVLGEWVQIQVPSSVVLSKYAIANRLTAATEAPKDWVLAGSLNNGSTWTLIDQKSSQVLVDAVDFLSNVTTPSFTTFRLIITKTQNSNVASIARVKLFGAYDSALPREILLIPSMVSNNHGSFTATASSSSTVSSEYLAFDSAIATNWSSAASKYTSQVSNGTAASTVTSVGTVLGEWVQIQLASKNRVTKYVVTPSLSNVPVSFLLVGSLNGTTWTLLDRQTDKTLVNETTYTCSAPGDFQYLRLIIDKVSSGSTGVTLVNFQVAGYELDRPFLETANVTPAALLTASSGGVENTVSTNWLNGTLSGNAGSTVSEVLGVTSSSTNTLNTMTAIYSAPASTLRGPKMSLGSLPSLEILESRIQAGFTSVLDACLAMSALAPRTSSGPYATTSALSVNGSSFGQFGVFVNHASLTIPASYSPLDYFTSTKDTRAAFLLVNGDLTITSATLLKPSVRKLFCVIYVSGNLVVNGEISMSARGANHSGTGESGGFVSPQNIRIATGTFSSIVNPEIPATGGGGSITGTNTLGATGGAGSNGGTGGGGSGGKGGGAATSLAGQYAFGATGTSYSGGSGGGGITASSALTVKPANVDAEPNGGKGGLMYQDATSYTGGNGAGNPVNGTGGTLIIICNGTVSGSGSVTSNGSAASLMTTNGGALTVQDVGGGGSGGGSVTILCKSGSVATSVSGGGAANSRSGLGGAGSARVIALDSLVVKAADNTLTASKRFWKTYGGSLTTLEIKVGSGFVSLMDASYTISQMAPSTPAAYTTTASLSVNSLLFGAVDVFMSRNSLTTISSGYAPLTYFTNVKDTRAAFTVFSGDLTISTGAVFTPPARKLFWVVFVGGNLVVNGQISMTARGSNHSGTGESGGYVAPQALRVATGTFSGTINPEIPATGGSGAGSNGSGGSGTIGITGGAGSSGGTGGGGGGGYGSGTSVSGYGAAGTSYSGGSGGGGISATSSLTVRPATSDAEINGGRGGLVYNNAGGGDGAGNPVNGTGGTLIIICNGTVSGSGSVTSNGSAATFWGSTRDNSMGGGGSGGGSVTILCKSGTVAMTASGGGAANSRSGLGGAGTTRLLTL